MNGYSILLSIGSVAANTDKPPTWPKKYMICGILQLPYAEIKEPFCGYYDSEGNRSRIDYYPGERTWKSMKAPGHIQGVNHLPQAYR